MEHSSELHTTIGLIPVFIRVVMTVSADEEVTTAPAISEDGIPGHLKLYAGVIFLGAVTRVTTEFLYDCEKAHIASSISRGETQVTEHIKFTQEGVTCQVTLYLSIENKLSEAVVDQLERAMLTHVLRPTKRELDEAIRGRYVRRAMLVA